LNSDFGDAPATAASATFLNLTIYNCGCPLAKNDFDFWPAWRASEMFFFLAAQSCLSRAFTLNF
jgi:hypothetical protein